MKFRKILLLDFKEKDFEQPYWERLDKLCDERALISVSSLDISRPPADVDCLLVKLGASVSKETIDAIRV